jgi:hypothetical protein
MRVSPARCTFVALIIAGLAGCNCGSRWSLPSCSVPNLAFWKNSPFKSSSDTTATAMGTPARPSVLASRAGMVGPGGGYAAGSAGASSTSPYLGTTAGPGTVGGYPTTQQPYASYPPTGYSSYSPPAAGIPPYMAPQVGAYGAGGNAPPAGASSYVNTSPYSGTAAAPYGPLSNSGEMTSGNGYATANTNGPYARSLPSSPSSASVADRYASRYDRSKEGADRLTERFDRSRSGADRYAGGYDRSASGGDRYSPGTASSPAPWSQAGRTAEPYGPTGPAAGYSDGASSPYAGGSPYPGSSPYAATPQGSSSPAGAIDRYSAGGQGAGSTAGGGYALSSAGTSRPRYPAAADPNVTSPEGGYYPPASGYTPGETGYTPGDTGYIPGDTGYIPGDTGYTPPGVSPYRPPASPYTLPASNPDDPPPYRPGSTSDYVPRTPSASLPSSNSSAYPGGVRGTGAGVMPAEYAQPVSSGLR